MGLRPQKREEVARPKQITRVKPSGARGLAEVLLARHSDMGIPEITQPFEDVSKVPTVPGDITSLSDPDLSNLYGQLDAFAAFVGYRLAEAEVRKLDVGRQLKDLEASKSLYGLTDVKKGDITRKRMEVFLDTDLVAMRTAETYHCAEVKLLKSRYEGIERTIRVLSREQSRRESHNGRRGHNQP